MNNHRAPMLDGCKVLSPLETSGGQERRRRTTRTDAKTAGRRFQAVNAFADFTLAALSRAEIAVWLLLWRDTKPDGLARTSQADLARRAGIAERTVRRAIESLRTAGLVTLVYRGGLRRGSSTYRVHALAEGNKADTHVRL